VKNSALGLIELFVVLMFATGWGVLELVVLRMDRRRKANERGSTPLESAGEPRHAERQ
jgi:hypothetical protein